MGFFTYGSPPEKKWILVNYLFKTDIVAVGLKPFARIGRLRVPIIYPPPLWDHLPDVLRAISTVLSQSQASDIQSIVQQSWEHGVLRATQGFEPTEIARGIIYCQVIFLL